MGIHSRVLSIFVSFLYLVLSYPDLRGSPIGVVEDREVVSVQLGPSKFGDSFDEDLGPVGPQPLQPSLRLHESLYGLPKLHEGTTRTVGGASRTLWFKDKCANQCLLRSGKAAILVYVAKFQRFTRVTPEEYFIFILSVPTVTGKERVCLSNRHHLSKRHTTGIKAQKTCTFQEISSSLLSPCMRE